jgi:citrate synthase
VNDALARRERIMGFGHRVYRAEDPRSRILKQVAKDLGSPRAEIAEQLEQVAHEAIARKHPDHSWPNVEFWSAIVLDIAGVPPQLAPAMFACSRTAGWSAHVLEQKRLGVLIRPSARYVGPGSRSLQEV